MAGTLPDRYYTTGDGWRDDPMTDPADYLELRALLFESHAQWCKSISLTLEYHNAAARYRAAADLLRANDA